MSHMATLLYIYIYIYINYKNMIQALHSHGSCSSEKVTSFKRITLLSCVDKTRTWPVMIIMLLVFALCLGLRYKMK